jgi:hypothetical protein
LSLSNRLLVEVTTTAAVLLAALVAAAPASAGTYNGYFTCSGATGEPSSSCVEGDLTTAVFRSKEKSTHYEICLVSPAGHKKCASKQTHGYRDPSPYGFFYDGLGVYRAVWRVHGQGVVDRAEMRLRSEGVKQNAGGESRPAVPRGPRPAVLCRNYQPNPPPDYVDQYRVAPDHCAIMKRGGSSTAETAAVGHAHWHWGNGRAKGHGKLLGNMGASWPATFRLSKVVVGCDGRPLFSKLNVKYRIPPGPDYPGDREHFSFHLNTCPQTG